MESACAKRLGILPLLAILVVLATLLGIADHVVSLVQGLELCLCLWVVRMKVGMKLLGPLQVSLLHILLIDILVDTQNLVIVYKCHKPLSPFFKKENSNFYAEMHG